MAYSPQLLDHYENPRNVGSLDKNDPAVGTGLTGAPACGDVMRLQIRVIVQDLWLWFSHCVKQSGYRMGQR
jgi:NifU-like protein involved in Fe-S cluster formation